jgi:hypothetical protein
MATYNTIADGLRLSGSTGCTNDLVNSWLKGLSLTGTTPDMLFTYLRSTGLTGSLSDMLSTYVFGQINFIELEAAASAYYSLSAQWIAPADFRITGDFVWNGSGTQILFGDSLSSDSYLAVLASGAFRARIAGFTMDSGVVVVANELSTLDVGRLSNVVTSTLNGTQVSSGTSSGSVAIDSFGKFISGLYFNGIISNPRLTDISTPSNSLPFTLGELTANYELPINNVYGSELVTNGDFATDTDWTKGTGITITTGACVFTAVASNVAVQQDAGAGLVNAGDVVEVTVEVTAITLGQFKFRVDAGAFVDIPNTVGVHTAHAIVGATGLGRIQITALGTTTGSFDNITVKQVTNVLTYNNIATTQDVRDTYTLSNDGTQWVGALQTIDIAAQAPTPTALFNSSGVLTCNGTLACASTIPCGV